jgi:ABC-type antimicrobial peptide transport system permease subunit
MVVGRGLVTSLIGAGIGVAAAFALTRGLSGMLYGVAATDPLVFGGVPLLLIAVSLLASYLPARKATRIDPLAALRYE